MLVFDWMDQWRQEGEDEQVVRSFLGRMLFGQDDIKNAYKCYRVVNKAVCYWVN